MFMNSSYKFHNIQKDPHFHPKVGTHSDTVFHQFSARYAWIGCTRSQASRRLFEENIEDVSNTVSKKTTKAIIHRQY